MDLKIRKSKKSYTIADMYKPWVKENSGVDMPYLRFKRILALFNKSVLESVQDRSESFKMPYGLGYIMIVKYRPKSYTDKSLSVDYKASKEYDKKIYHLNEHSNGYKYRLYWSKTPQTFPDRYKYKLNFVRANKRRLAKLIFDHKDYINIDDIQVYKM